MTSNHAVDVQVGFCLLAAVWQMGVYPQAGMGIALGGYL